MDGRDSQEPGITGANNLKHSFTHSYRMDVIKQQPWYKYDLITPGKNLETGIAVLTIQCQNVTFMLSY